MRGSTWIGRLSLWRAATHILGRAANHCFTLAANRSHVRLATLSIALTAGFPPAPVAMAQSYPAKPLRLVIDTAPGGVTDILGRMSADALTQLSGRQEIGRAHV